MLRKLGFGFTAMAIMTPGIAAALGVGEYELNSYLNQPLDMEVALHEVGDLSADEILVNLAPQSEFDSAGVDRTYFLNRLQFAVEVVGKDKAVLHVTTDQPVREPYLNFLVEFLWPTGRLMREYTVLLDPPSFAQTATATAPVISRAPQPVTRRETPAPASSASPSRPAAAPSSAAAAPAAQTASAADSRDSQTTSYTVKASDTLWQIALERRPADSVSVQQMLVAIQQVNPDAFINNNVNLVREGTVLRIPGEQEVRAISTRSALAEVADQNRQWRDMLEQRGLQQPQQRAQLDGSRQQAESPEQQGADSKGQVKLVAPESAAGVTDGDSTGSSQQGDANTAVLENELAIRGENLDQLDRENAELKSRLSELEAQNQTRDQLLELRNSQIAQLQQELRKLREAQGVESADNDPLLQAPEATDEPEQSRSDAGEQGESSGSENSVAAAQPAPAELSQSEAVDGDEAPQTPADAVSSTDAGQAAAQESESPRTDASEAAPVNPAPDAVKPKPEVQTEAQATSPGIIAVLMENLLYIALAALAILLLIAVLLRNRKNEQANDVMFDNLDDDDERDDSFAMQPDDQSAVPVDGTEDDEPVMPDTDSNLDPLEDVDVYVAYGRYPQAVDFLRNEINKHPQRDDLKIRLLELLDEMNDDAAFQQQVTAYRGISSDVDAAIVRLGGGAEQDSVDNTGSNIENSDEELSLDDLEMGLSSGLSSQDAGPDSSHDAITMETEKTDADLDDELADFDFELEDSPEADEDQTLVLDDITAIEANDDVALSEGESGPVTESDAVSNGDALSIESTPVLELDDIGAAKLDADDQYDDLNLDEISAEFNQGTDPSSEDEELDLSLDDLDLDFGSDEDDGQAVADLADLDLELEEAEKALDDHPENSVNLPEQDQDEVTLELDNGLADEVPAIDHLDVDGSLEDLPSPRDDDDSQGSIDLELSLDSEPETEGVENHSDVGEQSPALAAATPSAEPEAGEDSATQDTMLSDEDDFDFLGETDENATKLDLARAYIDMGDADGARDILSEVVAEGNEQQQGEARELMSQLG